MQARFKKFKYDVVEVAADLKAKFEKVIVDGLSDHPVSAEPGVVQIWNVAGIAKCNFKNKWPGLDPEIFGAGANNGMIVEQAPVTLKLLRKNPLSEAEKYEERVITQYPLNEDQQQYEIRARKGLALRAALARESNVMFDFAQSYFLPAFTATDPLVDQISFGEVEMMYRAHGFTILKNPEAPIKKISDVLMQAYGKRDPKDAFSFIAYDPMRVQYSNDYNLAGIISEDHLKQGRMQAATFRHLDTKQEFVVVNLVQDYGLVGDFIKPDAKIKAGAVDDVKKIIDHCRANHLPCIVAGDFNVKPDLVEDFSQQKPGKPTLAANDEQAKWVEGACNSAWNPAEQTRAEAKQVDFIFLSESFRRLVLRENLDLKRSASLESFSLLANNNNTRPEAMQTSLRNKM